MKPQRKNIITALIIGSTFVLGGVGIFTALRLYQLKDQGVAPNAPQSKLFAWDCSKYVFNVEKNGDVSVENSSDKTEPAQKVDIFIDNAKTKTLDVPSFGPRSPKTPLGKVDVPVSGNFDWKAVGTLDCQNDGSYKPTSECDKLVTTPDSGNWNITPGFTTRNTSSNPITVHWKLDCESRTENKGKPAMASCKNSEGDITLKPNETLAKGLGAVCLTWQYDFTCGGKDFGFVVEPQSCTKTPSPTPSHTPTATPTSTPTHSPTSTPTNTPTTQTSTPLPNLCSLNFSLNGETSTPTATPTTTPTTTPTGTPTTTPTGTATSTPTTTPAGTATSTPTSTATSTPNGSTNTPNGTSTPRPTTTPVTLPAAGVSLPTLTLILGGAILAILAVVIAL